MDQTRLNFYKNNNQLKNQKRVVFNKLFINVGFKIKQNYDFNIKNFINIFVIFNYSNIYVLKKHLNIKNTKFITSDYIIKPTIKTNFKVNYF